MQYEIKAVPPASGYDLSTNSDLLKLRSFDFSNGHKTWEHTILGPSGFLYHERDYSWAVDINANGFIN